MKRDDEIIQYQSSNRFKYAVSIATLMVFWAAPAFAQTGPEAPAADAPGTNADEPQQGEAQPGNVTTIARDGDRIVVTAGRIEEDLQEGPIPVSFVDADFLSDSGASIGDRNIFDEDDYEQLTAAPGGSGLHAGQIGDPRTTGITLRGSF
jgi:outer membrane receptor protein involved in Fe transport